MATGGRKHTENTKEEENPVEGLKKGAETKSADRIMVKVKNG